MSNNCLAGFPAFGPRVETNITYHPKELLFDPAQDIPTSEPETAQVQFTIEQGDLPTFALYDIPFKVGELFYNKYACYLWISVQNPTAGSIGVTCKYKKANTPSWTTSGSSIPAGNYGCDTVVGLTLPALGDVQEVKVYANVAGAKLLKAYMFIMPNYLGSGLMGMSVADVEVDLIATSPIGGLAVTNSVSYWRQKISSNTSLSGDANIRVAVGELWSTWGFGIAPSPTDIWYKSATESLRHWCPYYPTRIAYTPIL